MTKAILIAGDRDFKPVVEALVQRLGIYVHLIYEKGHCSKESMDAADKIDPMDVIRLCNWTRVPSDKPHHYYFPYPTSVGERMELWQVSGAKEIRNGQLPDGRKARWLVTEGDGAAQFAVQEQPNTLLVYTPWTMRSLKKLSSGFSVM